MAVARRLWLANLNGRNFRRDSFHWKLDWQPLAARRSFRFFWLQPLSVVISHPWTQLTQLARKKKEGLIEALCR